MTVFPQHWSLKTVADVGRIDLGRQRHPDWHHGPEMHPYLRVANVFEDRIDATDLKTMDFSGVFERFRLHPGDVLLNEGQTPELLGRPAIYRGSPPDVAFTNSLIRFRAGPDVLPEWALVVFRRHMHFGRFTRESRITTNIAHLSVGRLKTVEFPVPALEEQRRIVDILEDHLYRIDAAGASLQGVQRRIRALELSFAAELIRQSWPMRRLAEVLEFSIGGVWGSEPGVGEVDVDVLRVTELKAAGRIDPCTAARRSVSRKQLATRALRPGDLLLEKSGGGPTSPVGRVGLVPDLDRAAICSNFMQLMRPDPQVVVPEFLHSFLNAFQLSGGTLPMQSASTNIRNLKASEYLEVSVPVPPIDDQIRRIEEDSQRRESRDLLMTAVGVTRRRAASLRRSLLDAAFSGRLTGASSDMDRVEELAGV